MAATHIFVVSDCAGFVGAFADLAAARAAMVPYSSVPHIVHRFPAAPAVPIDTTVVPYVWIVPYCANDAVAWASTDRAAAERAHTALSALGLVYPDEIDYWRQPFGIVVESAAERLSTRQRVHESFLGDGMFLGGADADLQGLQEADLKRARQFDTTDGPLERLIRENERFDILEFVVEYQPRDDLPATEVTATA